MNGMGTVADVRTGRSARVVVAAAASVFVPITLVAWVYWQNLEGEEDTLLSDQFSQWQLVTLGGAALTWMVAVVFWQSHKARVGALIGAVLAGLAVMVGLVVDIVTSGGLA